MPRFINPNYIRNRERTILVTPDGEEYDLHGSSGRYVLDSADYGMPPIDYVTQRGPLQHGETVLGAWLRPRTVQLTLRAVGCSRQEYWQRRAELLNLVRHNRSSNLVSSQHKIARYLPSFALGGASAAINRFELSVVPDSAPTFPAQPRGSWDHFGFTEVLRFIAYDPTWLALPQKSASFATVSDYVSVDFPDDYPIGGSDYLKVATCRNAGTWLDYPVITITGPISTFQIYNASTQKILAFTGTVPSGQTAVIDLRYGLKTAVRSDGTNMLGFLTDDSELARFAIDIDPIVANGDNTIYVHGTGQGGATNFAVTWYDRYIGI